MTYLIIASLIWCFSFGLIGKYLSDLPAAWLATARLLLAFTVFLPFIRRIRLSSALLFTVTGAIQFGFMYLAYMYSYQYLKSHEIALFTIFTPLYVSLINDIQLRKLNRANLAAALLSAAGAGVVLWNKPDFSGSITGFMLVQAANLLFALGQMLYRSVYSANKEHLTSCNDRNLMAWLYLGGFAILLPLALKDMVAAQPIPDLKQLSVILYLGVVASGVAFFLWNKGCRKVKAGTLAVMNNLKVPTAVLVSLTIFQESANHTTLICGSILIGFALWLTLAKKMP